MPDCIYPQNFMSTPQQRLQCPFISIIITITFKIQNILTVYCDNLCFVCKNECYTFSLFSYNCSYLLGPDISLLNGLLQINYGTCIMVHNQPHYSFKCLQGFMQPLYYALIFIAYVH